VPVLAIGGVNATRAAEVLAAGPVGIAVKGGRDAGNRSGARGEGLLRVPK
jgi:hypothetical protein